MIEFLPLKRRKVEAEFSGGEITSDAGVLLLRQADRQLGLLKQVASVVEDRRLQDMVSASPKIRHSINTKWHDPLHTGERHEKKVSTVNKRSSRQSSSLNRESPLKRSIVIWESAQLCFTSDDPRTAEWKHLT